MKKSKMFISILLILSMCFTLASGVFAAEPENEAVKSYPTVFVHGLMGWGQDDGCNGLLPYWGATSGSVLDYLESQGYENLVDVSVGPVSSAWDRCCELFAQLTGTRVDYGQAHVNKILANFDENNCDWGHARYGRDYTGKASVENWGPIYDENGKVTGWNDNKINLVGHSFGGPTITMFLNLLAEGNAAEREWAKEEYGENWKDYCSPLFWGDYDGEQYVNSLTSLAGVLNGTTFIDSCDTSTEVISDLVIMAGNVLGDSLFNRFYDFQLDQFGITAGEITDEEDIAYALDVLEASHFLDCKDNAIYDLSIVGCNELKRGWKCYDNVYYFAYAGCTTHEVYGGYQIPNANTWLPFLGFAAFMGSYTNDQEVVKDIYGEEFCRIDQAWLANDGMVNTITASYVFGCPHKEWDGVVESGKWITMPSYGFDHMDYIGGLLEPTQNPSQTKAFFDDVMKNITATYKPEKLKAPQGLTVTTGKLLLARFNKLTWSKVDGADSYKVYRATSPNGSYRLMATVSKTSWTDPEILKGMSYYYKVAACQKNDPSRQSGYSAVINSGKIK